MGALAELAKPIQEAKQMAARAAADAKPPPNEAHLKEAPKPKAQASKRKNRIDQEEVSEEDCDEDDEEDWRPEGYDPMEEEEAQVQTMERLQEILDKPNVGKEDFKKIAEKIHSDLYQRTKDRWTASGRKARSRSPRTG
eukprot:11185819-Heterocapsa_arctica.AAC.2